MKSKAVRSEMMTQTVTHLWEGSAVYNSPNMSTPCVQVWCFCQCTEASPCVRCVCRVWSRNSARQCFRMVLSVPLSEQDLVQLQHPSVFLGFFFSFQFPELCQFISVLPTSTFVLHAPLIVSRSYLVLWFLPCNTYKAVDIQFFRFCCWMSSICFAFHCFFYQYWLLFS